MQKVADWVASLVKAGVPEAEARAYVGEPEAPPRDFAVWPENWPAVQVFCRMNTNWLRDPVRGRLTGLRYEALLALVKLMGIAKRERPELVAKVQVLEAEALRVMRG